MQLLFWAHPHENAGAHATPNLLKRDRARHSQAGYATTVTEDECAVISQALREELPIRF